MNAITLSRPNITTTLKQSQGIIDATAHRLSEKLRDPSGIDDYRQELVLHLLQRWDRFDPSRGSVRTFVRRLVENRERDLIRKFYRKRHRCGQTIQWPVSPHDGELFDVIDHRSVPGEDWREVDAAIDGLIAPEKTICQLYRTGHTISEIAKRLNLTRASIYRSLQFVGEYFENRGLREYIDFPSAQEANSVTDV